MHALFKPKAQTGQNPFTRRMGKIYFRKILLVPQPLDHKKDRESNNEMEVTFYPNTLISPGLFYS